MDKLSALVKDFKFHKAFVRTNLGGAVVHYPKSRFLKEGIFSNSVRSGPILSHVQSMLGPEISELCLNYNVTCAAHRDGKNSSTQSYICFFGDYLGGALHLETGEVFESRGVWHTFDGRNVTHWNTPHTGDKWSCVAYARTKARAPVRKARSPEQLDHSAAPPPIH
jgi:hypothetical protein